MAGLWYLLLVFAGPLRLLYIPKKLFVMSDPAATASNIASHEWLFRLGMVSLVLGAVVLIFLTMAFYRLFKDIDQRLAVLLVIFGGVMPAVMDLMNVGIDGGALWIARGGGGFDTPLRDALVMTLVRLNDSQFTVSEILWGMWLFPMAALAYKSGFIPRFIGVWLYINGAAYVILCLTGILFPTYEAKLFMYFQPALFGELAIVLWLLIKGGGEPTLAAA